MASIRRAEEKQRLKEKKEKKIEKEKKYLERLQQLKSSIHGNASSREVYEFFSQTQIPFSNAMVKLSTPKSSAKDSLGTAVNDNTNRNNNHSIDNTIVASSGNRIQRRQVSFDICTDNDFSDEATDDERVEDDRSDLHTYDLMSHFIPIRSLTDELVDRIEFIFIDEKCVFSKSDSSIWDVCRREFQLKDDMHQSKLKKDATTAIAATTSNDSNSKLLVVSGTSSSKSSRKTYLDIFIAQAIDVSHTTSEQVATVGAIDDDARFNSIRLSQCLMHSMVPFLSIQEMMYFSLTCKALKSLCNKDMQFRIRRKEAFAMVSHEYSKAKKNEKKKKIKQANVKKMTKKDAFARGGNDGMH